MLSTTQKLGKSVEHTRYKSLHHLMYVFIAQALSVCFSKGHTFKIIYINGLWSSLHCTTGLSLGTK